MNNKSRFLIMTVALILLASMISCLVPINAQVSTEHVYYGYVPPSTDVVQWPTIEPTGGHGTTRGQVDEVIHGAKINYTVPSGVAILDVVGLVDGTRIEIWDIYANREINSTTINKLEKKFFYIRYGTFFKIVASERVAALLNGGGNTFIYGEVSRWPGGGTSTFYPAVTGGFRGKEFIFNAAPPTHPYAYSIDRIGYNFYLMALEGTDWSLADSINVWSTSGHLAQHGKKTILLQSRVEHLAVHGGVGSDVVYHLTTTGDVEVSCCALDDFLAVPAITGGYVGKLFYAPEAVTLEESGRTAVFIAIPLEEGQVKVYDKDLKVIATHSFTASDVSDRNYWYYNLGVGKFDLIADSTGNICLMVGQTEGTADISHLGDDITYIGSKPNQEMCFYAPTMAVVFAPEALTAAIDGGAPVQMAKDDFRLLESGAHSISADKHVIVEILSAGGPSGTAAPSTSWDDWGSYLIEPADMDVSFAAPADFTSRPVDYTMYIAIAVVSVVIVALAFFMMRRRRPKQV